MLVTATGMLFLLTVGVRGQASEKVPQAAAQLVAQGDAQAKQQNFAKALGFYKKADEAAHHTSVTCLLRVAGAERDLGDLGKAADTALQAAKVAGTPELQVAAQTEAGDLLTEEAGFGHPKKKPLGEAEAAYRAALAAAGGSDTTGLQFRLALVLMREGAADGAAQMQTLAGSGKLSPDDTWKAKEILADPGLAAEPLPPNFSLAASDGQTYTADGVRGKVVLLDFWGSWCEPCRDSAPMLASIHQKFAKQADFVMLGVNTDDTTAKMETFAKTHAMVWPEYFDGTNAISDRFSVHEFPTFMVMQRDGSIAYLSHGLMVMPDGSIAGGTQRAIETVIEQALKQKH